MSSAAAAAAPAAQKIDLPADKETWNFTSAPNLHPVYYTGIRPARPPRIGPRVKGPKDKDDCDYDESREKSSSKKSKKDKSSPDGASASAAVVAGKELTQAELSAAWERYDQSKSFAPIESRSPTVLPKNWSEARPVPPDQWAESSAHMWLSIPSAVLGLSADTFEFDLNVKGGFAYLIAFTFVVKALTSSKEGTRSDGSVGKGFFMRQADEARGLSECALPKLAVFIEKMAADYRGPLARYAREKHPGKTPDQIDMDEVRSDVEFRRRISARPLQRGVRLLIVVLDPKFSIGRSLSHRQWKNKLESGEASPAEIVNVYDKIVASYKARKVSFEGRCSKSSSSSSKEADREDASDVGPEVDAEEGLRTLEEQQREKEIEQILGDAAPEPEPDGENLCGGGGSKKGKKSKKKASGAEEEEEEDVELPPDHDQVAEAAQKQQQQQQQAQGPQETDRQRKSRESSECRRKLGYLGMRIRASDRDGEAYRRADNYLWTKFFGHDNGRGVYGADRVQKPVDVKHVRSMILGRMKPHEYHKMCTKTLLEMSQNFAVFLGKKSVASDPRSLENEAQDLGDFDHALNPRRLFTFASSVEALEPPGDPTSICAEQRDESNYFDPATGQFRFPLPDMVFRVPDHEFRARLFFERKCPWYFSAFEEKLEAVERKSKEKLYQSIRRDHLSGLNPPRPPSSPGPLASDGEEDEQAAEDRERRKRADSYMSSTSRGLMHPSKGSHKNPGLVAKRAESRAALFHNAQVDLIAERGSKLGVENDRQKAERERRAHIVSDVVLQDLGAAEELEQRVAKAVDESPEDRDVMTKLYRDHQFEIYKGRMRPGAKGVNDIFAAHANHLHTEKERARGVNFNFTGFDNLTYAGSIVAEFLLKAKHHVGLSHSCHMYAYFFRPETTS